MSLGLWSVSLRPMGTHTVRYGMRLRMTNVCLVSMPSNSDLHFRAYIRFFCNEELAAISILVPEEPQTTLDLTFPQDARIRIESDASTGVSISGIFLTGSGTAGTEEQSEPIFAHTGAARTSETLPTSDDVPNVAQDVLGNIHGKKDTAGTGDKITPALRRIFESTSRGITFEDLKPGLGHQVQEHSIVTFSTKMKDSVGAMVNRFSYELLACPLKQCTRILPGLSEGLEGMRAGGVRRVHLTPALVGDTWGHDGMEDLKDESLDLELELHKVECSPAMTGQAQRPGNLV